MRLANRAIKFFGYVAVQLLLIVSMFILSAIFSTFLFNVVLLAIDIITEMPEYIKENYWFLLFLSCIPLTVIFTVIVDLDILDLRTDWRYKRRLKKEQQKK